MAKVEKKRTLSDDRLRDFLREMLLIRRFEEKVEERFRAGELPGFLHVAIGQEAAEVGVCAAMEDGDVFGSTHRAHGHTLARGTHPNALMAELYGKLEGCSHGYGGSMHLYDVERGNLGANAVVAGGLPALVGAGLAFKLRDEPRVAVAFFGDGATNTGTFHESLNLAQLWKTKTVFVCENNSWAESTPGWQHSPVWNDMSKRAGAYDMHVMKVDGQDVEKVYEAACEALDYARSGQGPVFLDVETYRMHGHYIGDPQVYRSKEDRDDAAAHDPIVRLRERLERAGGRVAGARGRGAGYCRGRGRVREERDRPAARGRLEERLRLTLLPEISYREAVRNALAEAMRADGDVFVMGEDIAEMGGSMGVTQGLVEEFGPERVRNTPISEMAIVGAGIGAAMQGMRPVVEIMYEDFLTISLEQIVNQAAKHRYMSGGQLKVPITIRTQGGAGWSPGAQHAQQLEAWLVHVPGLKVRVPDEPGRCERPPLVGDLRRQPGDLLRAPAALPGEGRGAREDRARADWQGPGRARGERRDGDRHRPARPSRAPRGRGRREGRHLGRDRRPAHPAAARRGDARRVGEEDEPRGRRP